MESKQLAALLLLYKGLLNAYFELTNENIAFAGVIHKLLNLLDHAFNDLRASLPLENTNREALGIAQDRAKKGHKHLGQILSAAKKHVSHHNDQLEKLFKTLEGHYQHIEEDIKSLESNAALAATIYAERASMRMSEFKYFQTIHKMHFKDLTEVIDALKHALEQALKQPQDSKVPELSPELLVQLTTLEQEEAQLCAHASIALRQHSAALEKIIDNEFKDEPSLLQKLRKKIDHDADYMDAIKLHASPHPSLTPFGGKAGPDEKE